MTDKELLKLAAKAAGVSGVYRGDTVHIAGIYQYPNNKYWNPITDDGDALRLAVKLGISIDFNFADTLGEVSAAQVLQPYQYESMGVDPYAATRRAIVRAAAEVGKGMNET